MMKLRTTLNIIEPSEGMYFTQSNDVPIEDRIVSDKIYLSINDSIDNWKEISAEEAEAIRQIKEEYNIEMIEQQEAALKEREASLIKY